MPRQSALVGFCGTDYSRELELFFFKELKE